MGRGERYILEVEEGKARKREERGVLEKEMKEKIGRREGEEEKTLRVKRENERRGSR
jgi:hypothetical protein